jgi:hypothetical protein
VLVERDSLNYLAPLAQIVVGATYPLNSVLEAYRTGGGVSYGDYGVDLREGQAGMNRAAFLRVLGTEWLPSIPDVHARLQDDPPPELRTLVVAMAGRALASPRLIPRFLLMAMIWMNLL